jgi:catechol 2,3-dioxygenase-like lactoylglutathione lyase family enzyme
LSLGHIEHFLVLTDDMDGTRDWYERVLGLAGGERPPLPFPGYWLYLGDVPAGHVADRAAYEEHAASVGTGSSAAAGSTGAVDHIAFSATGYEQLRSRLAEAGVDAVENVVPGVMRQLFLRDPNGVRLELNVRD